MVDNAQRFEGIALAVEGETDEALAAALVDAMLREGFAKRG